MLRINDKYIKTVIQAPRDALAWEIFFALETDYPTCPEFFLYLRPFVSTGKLGINRVELPLECARQEYAYGSYNYTPAQGYIEIEDELETMLSGLFWPTAAFIGCGRLWEHLGAGRHTLTEGNWKDQIRKAILRSNGIILHPSYHEGTAWEISEIKKHSLMQKCIFFLGLTTYSQNELEKISKRMATIGVRFDIIFQIVKYIKTRTSILFKFNNEGDVTFIRPFYILDNDIFLCTVHPNPDFYLLSDPEKLTINRIRDIVRINEADSITYHHIHCIYKYSEGCDMTNS